MPDSNIIQIDQNLFETKLDRLVTEKMTQILNAMLDAEADEITGAARYERKEGRKAYRAGHYERTLTAKAGRLELRVPKLKGAVFESAVIERYRRRESSVEEALMEMYLAGVSTRQVDDISKLLWGDRMPSQTLSDKLKRVYDDIDRWRTRPLESEYPYVFMDGVWHKRSWGGSVENVSVLVAIGVNAEGHREVIGVTEGMREDAASWEQFIRSMIERGLKGVRLVVGDRCAGLVSTVNSMLPRAKYQRCMVHFMRNVLSKVPPNHRDWASAALKAIFAMESRESALAKAGTVAAEMESRKLKAAAGCLREGIGVTEGMREDAASWEQFIRSMIERGLKGVRLVVGDRCAGLVSTVNSMLPRAKYQRCMVHFMRNVLSKVPPNHRDWASAALKAIFAMESRESALAKAGTVAAEMESRKLKAAAGCLREGIGETTAYLLPEFPTEHRRRIRTNNMIERLNREIRRRTRVVGSFPDGNSALMLICARIRYVTANEWSTRRYLDMSRLDDNLQEAN